MMIISLSWMLIGVFLAIYDHFALVSHLALPSSDYHFIDGLLFHMGAGFAGGFVGSFVLLHVNDRYRSEPYYKGLIVIVIAFAFITTSITVITSAIYPSLEYPPFSAEWIELFRIKLWTTFHLKNILFWASVVALTYFFLQMSSKFGPGNLIKVLSGTYNVPKSENRIFMFMDLKSSTSIAEQLGSERYHGFLKTVFSDITKQIMESEGDIYQYVGDEIVISWPMSEKIKPEACLDCFFNVKAHLTKLEKKYRAYFGEIPVFKAGAHCGSVIAGEIGVIKRDITYSGDILNTTARIQGQCNSLDSEFLISDRLYDLIEKSDSWSFKNQGAIELKGKSEKVDLFSVSKQG